MIKRFTGRAGITGLRVRLGSASLICLLALFAIPTFARANVPFQTITSNGPIDQIVIGNDLSAQAHFKGDAVYSAYPPSVIPGDWGTFLAVGGTVYGPDFGSHDLSATPSSMWTPFAPVSQSGVSGAGTVENPFRVVTLVAAGAVQVKQTITYVEGRRSFRVRHEFANGGPAQPVVFYRAMDCYLAESDHGYGVFIPATGGAYCSLNPNNIPPGRVLGFTPLTPGSTYFESFYTTVWTSINGSPFPNTVDGDVFQDNGTGLSWSFVLPSGGSLTPAAASGRATASQAAATQEDSAVIDPRGLAPARCAGKNATFIGTDLADRLRGSKRADVMAGLGGKDKIFGRKGKDRLCGGPGNDVLVGGPGNDILIGGPGKDICKGGGGKDRAKGCEKRSGIP